MNRHFVWTWLRSVIALSLCLTLVLPSNLNALAPPTRLDSGELDAAAVLALIRGKVDSKEATLEKIAGILNADLAGAGWQVLDESPQEVLLVHPSKKWALLFSPHRSAVTQNLKDALRSWNLQGVSSHPHIRRQRPEIFVTHYAFVPSPWVPACMDAVEIPLWTAPAELLASLAARAVPWDDFDLSAPVKKQMAEVVSGLGELSLPVRIVPDEGKSFRFQEAHGHWLEKFTLYQRDEQGRPVAILVPEGALLDAQALTVLRVALQRELNEQKFYGILRQRLGERLGFAEDSNAQAQLRDTARNLAVLAEFSAGKVSKRVLQTMLGAHERFLGAWKVHLKQARENLLKNKIFEALTLEDVRALEAFDSGKRGPDLIRDAGDAMTRLDTLLQNFIVSAPHDFSGWGNRKPMPEEADVESLLKEDRGLVLGDVEAIDEKLGSYSKRHAIPYLRVTLQDAQQWDRLLAEPRLVEKELFVLQGPLVRLIEDGGILVLDYEGTHPKFVAGLNSLFDRISHYAGHRVSDQLKVIGVTKPERLPEFSSDFFSRSAIPTVDWSCEDPLAKIQRAEEPVGEIAELYHSPQYQDELVGRYFVDGQGHPQVEEGKLLKAIKQGMPLTLQGVDWDDPAFAHLIRQVLRQGGVRFNGVFHRAKEGFVLHRAKEPDYSQGVTEKVIRGIDPLSREPFWVINDENANLLFAKNEVRNGLMTQEPGLLGAKKGSVLRLRIQGMVPDCVWHKIMHAEGLKIQIEVSEDAEIPEPYLNLKETEAKAVEESPWRALDDVKGDPVVVVTSQDTAYAQSRIEQALADRSLVVFPAGPYTTLGDLTGSIKVKIRDGERKLFWRNSGVLKSLKQGKTVVLTHLESNPVLAKQLESAMSEQPYLMINGNRVDLPTTKGGRLVLVGREDTFDHAVKKVSMEPKASEYHAADNFYPILLHEFPRLTREAWAKLRQLQKAFETIPLPQIPRHYPADPLFTLSRLRRVLSHEDWAQGIREVFIEEYRHVPEVMAFMDVSTRLLFGKEEQTLRIDKEKLRVVDNQVIDHMPMEKKIWQYADCLSLDLLKKSGLDLNYGAAGSNTVLETILGAKITASQDQWQEFHKDKFRRKIGRDSPPANALPSIRIEEEAGIAKAPETELYERAREVLLNQRAVRFTGPPGVGKSHVAKDLGEDKKLGYEKDQIYGPVTTGPKVRLDELIRKKLYSEDQGHVSQDQVIGAWAKDKRGGLLIVDEFNLPPETFWNIMEGFFAPKPYIWVDGRQIFLNEKNKKNRKIHRIIFTGNQESVLGRKESRTVREHFTTVYFPELSPEFLRKQVSEYLAPAIAQREELAKYLVDLHEIFQKMGKDRNFSLRKLQEVSDRINQSVTGAWDIEKATLAAWRVYEGDFTPVERLALRQVIKKKYLVDIIVADEQAFKEWTAPADLSGNVVRIASAMRLVYDTETFLDMREARAHRQEGQPDLQGQRGMIVEGAPARGKDFVILAELKARGYVEAKDKPTDVSKKFYHLNASVDYDKVVSTILRARQEGSIVVVSELNVLPSELIEGALNDVLTGAAAPGFAFIATVNAASFSGREHFSSALQDRLWIRRVEDYSRAELFALARQKAAASIQDKTLQQAVDMHCWIRHQIAQPRYRPTLRELERALSKLEQGKSARDAVTEVYGPVYLNVFLKGKPLPKKITNAEEFEKEPDSREVVKLVGNFLMPDRGIPLDLKFDAVTKNAGYQVSSENFVAFNSGLTPDELLETADHEFSHGIFTRYFGDLRPGEEDPFWQAYMWLEDRRQENAMQRFYPGALLEKNNEAAFLQGIDAALRNDSWWTILAMKPRDIFLLTLSTYGKGLLGREQIQQLAKLSQNDYEPNPFALALKHLDTTKDIIHSVPATLDEEEIQFQQYRALVLMQSLKEDFAALPEKPKEKPRVKTKEESQKLSVRASEKLAKVDMAHINLEPSKGAEPVNVVLSAAEMGKRAKTFLGWQSLMRRALMKMMSFYLRSQSRFSDLSLTVQSKAKRWGPILIVVAVLAAIVVMLPSWKDSLATPIMDASKRVLSEPVSPVVDTVKRVVNEPGQGLGGPGQAWAWKNMVVGLLLVTAMLPILMRFLPRVGAILIPGTHALESDSDPVSMMPANALYVRPLDYPLLGHEVNPPNEHVQQATKKMGVGFRRKLARYFMKKLLIDRVYGTEGNLDAVRLFTGDPSTAFLRSGARYRESPKEIVLVKTAFSTAQTWNPLLDEIFRALFEQGASVTVYSGDSGENLVQEGICTVRDLREVFLGSPPVAGLPEVEKDIAKRKEPGAYVRTTLEELQSAVESEYVYHLMNQLAEQIPAAGRQMPRVEEKAEAPRPAWTPEAQRLSELGIEDQAKYIIQELKKQAVEVKRETVMVSDTGIIIQLESDAQNLKDIEFLRGASHVSVVIMHGFALNDYSPLGCLEKLHTLVIGGVRTFGDREMLQIVSPGKTKALRTLVVPGTCFHDLKILLPWRESLDSLNAENTMVVDGDPLGEFTSLASARFDGTPLSSLCKPAPALQEIHVAHTHLSPPQIADFMKDYHDINVVCDDVKESVQSVLHHPEMMDKLYQMEDEKIFAEELRRKGLTQEQFILHQDRAGCLIFILKNLPPDMVLECPPLPLRVRLVRVVNSNFPHFKQNGNVRSVALEDILHDVAFGPMVADPFPNLSGMTVVGSTQMLPMDEASNARWTAEGRVLRDCTWNPPEELKNDRDYNERMLKTIPANTIRVLMVGAAVINGEPQDMHVVLSNEQATSPDESHQTFYTPTPKEETAPPAWTPKAQWLSELGERNQAEYIIQELEKQGVDVKPGMVVLMADGIHINFSPDTGNFENLRNIEFLRGASRVVSVQLKDLRLKDYSPIGALENLTELSIRNISEFGNDEMRQITAPRKIKHLKSLDLSDTSFEQLKILLLWRDSLEKLVASRTMIVDGDPLKGFSVLRYAGLGGSWLWKLWTPAPALREINFAYTHLSPLQIAKFKTDHSGVVVSEMELTDSVERILSHPETMQKSYQAEAEKRFVEELRRKGISEKQCYLTESSDGSLMFMVKNLPPDMHLECPPLPLSVRVIRIANANMPKFQKSESVRSVHLNGILHSVAFGVAMADPFPNLISVGIEGSTKMLPMDKARNDRWIMDGRILCDWTWKPDMGLNTPRDREWMLKVIPANTIRIHFLDETLMNEELQDMHAVLSNPAGANWEERHHVFYTPSLMESTIDEEIEEEMDLINSTLADQGVNDASIGLTRAGDALYLNLGNADLTSLEFLRNCRHLKKVILGPCPKLRDFSPLSSLKTLRSLDVRSPFFGDDDLRMLSEAGLPLVELKIAGTSVSDLAPLAKWAGTLAYIDFSDTPVDSSYPLSYCVHLKHVIAKGTRIRELRLGLNSLTSLEAVHVQESDISVEEILKFLQQAAAEDVQVFWRGNKIDKKDIPRNMSVIRKAVDWYQSKLRLGFGKVGWGTSKVIIGEDISNDEANELLKNTQPLYSHVTIADREMVPIWHTLRLRQVRTLTLENVHGTVDLSAIAEAMPNLRRLVVSGNCEQIDWRDDNGDFTWRHDEFREFVIDRVPFSQLWNTPVCVGFMPASTKIVEINHSGTTMQAIIDRVRKIGNLPSHVVLRADNAVDWVPPVEQAQETLAPPEQPQPPAPSFRNHPLGSVLQSLILPEETRKTVLYRFQRQGREAIFHDVLHTLAQSGSIPADFISTWALTVQPAPSAQPAQPAPPAQPGRSRQSRVQNIYNALRNLLAVGASA